MSNSSIWVWPFELIEKIGEGGMGVVYKARYVKDDRMFAVKLIPKEISNPTLLARFEREIAVLKSLRHPNIVRAFGGVCEDKQRFYAMELVEGGTLWDKIRSAGYLEWQKVTDYGQQMCAALAYAHGKKIVHRDIKPNNFLINRAGQVKLSDFGLVSVMSEARLTADGRTMGTIQYMSPEQIRGKPPLNHASDLYSLGCVFYEMLTGHPPFDYDNPGQTLHAHLNEKPKPISEFNRECPAQLERLVHQLLEKKIEDRPASAVEVAERLSKIRISPHLIETTVAATSGTKLGSQAPPRSESNQKHDSLIKAAERSFGLFWIAVCASFLIWSAVSVVGFFQADPGVDLWVQTMYEHPDEHVRAAAATNLAKLSSRYQYLDDELMKVIEDENAAVEVRVNAIMGLGENGKDISRYQTRLIKVAKVGSDERVRSAASRLITNFR
ncbi:MAG: protein kinase [Planctomycetaceae bacterium]|nr:protein kinase [Planctomycetaceae bacterium]